MNSYAHKICKNCGKEVYTNIDICDECDSELILDLEKMEEEDLI